MKSFKTIVLILSSLIFVNCTNDNSNLSESDIITLKDAIEEIVDKEKRLNHSFLVSPYLSSFGFHPYFIENGSSTYNDKMTKEIFDILNWNEEHYDLRKKEIDARYGKEQYLELLNLSDSNSSNWVLSFSGLDKNIVFLELIRFCDEISKQELIDRSIMENPYKAEICSSAFIIEDNKSIEIVPINCVHTEKCIEARE